MTVIAQLLHLPTYIIRKIFISFFNISTYLFKFSIIPESLYTYILLIVFGCLFYAFYLFILSENWTLLTPTYN